MKNLLLHIKILFFHYNIKRSFLIFIISFPMILIIFYILLKITTFNFVTNNQQIIRKQLIEVFNMPHTTNDTIIIEYENLPEEMRNYSEDSNFWHGTAIQYRYSVEKNK